MAQKVNKRQDIVKKEGTGRGEEGHEDGEVRDLLDVELRGLELVRELEDAPNGQVRLRNDAKCIKYVNNRIVEVVSRK